MTAPAPGEILRAPLFHTPRNPFLASAALESFEDGALMIHDGKIAACGDYASVKAAHPNAAIADLRGGFLLPGFIDTHIHFPQLRVLGGLGKELLEWLEEFALPEEVRMGDLSYACATAQRFVHALASHGTTTAMVFGAHFRDATAALFEAAAAKVRLVSGMVLSDRSLRPELHQTPAAAYRDSADLIRRFHGRGLSLYAVTPRFALSASEAILEVSESLMKEHPGVRFQTHLNENQTEIEEVSRAFPWAKDYLSVYERFHLTGRGAVMAHNVHPTAGELERLAASGTAISHCPCSNAALGSGIFPLKRHIYAGVTCALGTDVGAGTGFGMLKEGLQAYMMQRLVPDGLPMGPEHLLYLATRAGAEALRMEDQLGDFAIGKSADVVYIRPPKNSPLEAVVERAGDRNRILSALFTLGDSAAIREVRVGGATIYRGAADAA